MQVDFHHGVTYVVARIAGFTAEQASIIAYASQFVDDATDEGKLFFDNESIFEFISSAHKMLDYRNFEKLANHHVWIPFHFLPGNEYDPKLGRVVPDFVQRAICRPNSITAQEMIRYTIESREHPNSLYRLGISMHVYADTWAHQGFAGISHHVNTVQEICDHEGHRDESMHQNLQQFFGSDWFGKIRSFVESKLVNEFAPVGHGPVLSYPDRPYLRWRYVDWKGDTIERDNPKDYMCAVDHMYTALKGFLNGSLSRSQIPMHKQDRQKIEELLRDINDEDGDKRHQAWLNEIRTGRFSFGPDPIEYIPKGPGSWRHEVFPDVPSECSIKEWLNDHDKRKISHPEHFPFSHWKLFHDALECHRTAVLNTILPQFGIVAA